MDEQLEKQLGQQLDLVQQVYELVVNFMVTYSFRLVGAVLVIIVGILVARWVGRIVLRAQERHDVDVTLRQFIASTVRITVIALFAIIAMNQLGVSITPLIAAIGGLAVGVSFALQGPVANYGAGLVIILTRMYRVGDTVTIRDCSGLVEDISLATTVLLTEDGERIVIPNRQITGEIHTNSFANRVVEGRVGIAYSEDPERAIGIIADALDGVDGVSAEVSPQIGIAGFGDSSIDLDYRYWVPTNRYFGVMHEANMAVYRALKREGVSIPFPQREVRLLGEGAAAG
ncbi:MAG TPA: mechanosensitive ion channel domain-containing protein [Woeseiaceae bacterium]|nr:mechanosensitive ion channel domain-containing protein [Woeseiaceae bacterium]